jgi:hypothetical protein
MVENKKMKLYMITLLSLLTMLNFSCTEKTPVPQANEELDKIEVVESKSIDSADTNLTAEVITEMEVWREEVVEEKVAMKSKAEVIVVEVVEQNKETVSTVEGAVLEETKVESESTNINEPVEVDDNKMDDEEEVVVIDEVKADHSAFNDLLTKYVSSSGVVNYKGIKSEIGKLDTYLNELETKTVGSDWTRNEKLAYWINAYNAFTIKLILDNYPVNSIQDIAGGKPWDKKWIKLGSETYSLNQIENEIIRPQFNEPRIHFAVNCAAQSCPPLGNRAFTAENLNSLLEKQTRSFINNSKFNKISSTSAKVSKIFDWYGQDFGDLKTYLNKYSATQIAASTKIEYNDYNWSLNNQ